METAIAEHIFTSGPALALLGASFAACFGAVGSALGLLAVGKASSGVASERPELSGKLILLMALPGSQVVYGLLAAFMVTVFFKDIENMTSVQGVSVFLAALPVSIAGLISGIAQGKVAAYGTQVVAKDENNLGKAIIYAAIVETVAIFGLLVSILLFQFLSATA